MHVLSIASVPFFCLVTQSSFPGGALRDETKRALTWETKVTRGTFQASLIAVNLGSGSIFVWLGKQNSNWKAQLGINLRT